ncbi:MULTISPECIES: hypothetical protein [unclassified Acinetobacter]|uniref:hypothetical protein n=1 Tax=unclassified Acinetobacter TaxID=196816 RepID=UPI0035B7303B
MDKHSVFNEQTNLAKWWGQKQFLLNQSYAWHFGSLYCRIIRNSKEWRIEYHRPKFQHESQQDWQNLPQDMAFPEPVQFERYMFKTTQENLMLMPRLADRSVVIKPVQPIYIPESQQATLFISTPLWICGLVEQQRDALFDIPIIRPKDTWFGNPTMGQLCYATLVNGSVDLDLLPPRAFRAVTAIHFYNGSNQQMRLERINVPVPSLPLFYSESTQRLWTSEIKVYQGAIDKPPRIRIESRTPPMAGEVSFVQPARNDSAGFIYNMFDSLL